MALSSAASRRASEERVKGVGSGHEGTHEVSEVRCYRGDFRHCPGGVVAGMI